MFSSNDTFHARYYVLSGFNGNGPDTLAVEVNLNNALSGGNYVTQLKTVPLDTGAQYTSMVTDTSAGATGYSLTAITELKTAASPGNLWIYNQSSGAAYKILGPGGVPLPAVGSFLIPAQTNGGGALLVLINQDNLTLTNLSNPPLDTTPFTIIDLGQLIQTFSVQTTGGTVTLPFVTQISATTPYFAMLGAEYNPVNRLMYALVGGGSLTGVTGSVISYDPFHPGSPRETVVADVSNVPFNYGAYPQLALSAAAGTLQILTSNPSVLYSVGILGTGNLAVAVNGSTFPDSNFKPTSIAANPLMGETYIASTSGQVDILKSATAKPLATLSINGSDIATTTQSYSLQTTALSPVVDTALRAAPVTITATPTSSGTPFTVVAGTFSNFGLNPSSVSITFPALGVYTLVASIPATANYPAITSNPVNVTAQALSGVSYTVPANTAGTVVLTAAYAGDTSYSAAPPVSNTVVVGTATGLPAPIGVTSISNTGPGIPTAVSVTLLGESTTHPNPTGRITISITPSGGTPTAVGSLDAAVVTASNTAIGSVMVIFPAVGSYTITATYSGDSIFSSSTATNSIYIFVQTDTLAISGPATGPAPTPSITFNLTQTGTAAAISGTVTISSTCNGSAGPSTTIPASVGTAGPANFSLGFTTPGTCTLVASYPGDAANLPATSAGFTITLTSSGTPGFTSFVTGTSELMGRLSPCPSM